MITTAEVGDIPYKMLSGTGSIIVIPLDLNVYVDSCYGDSDDEGCVGDVVVVEMRQGCIGYVSISICECLVVGIICSVGIIICMP